MRRYIGAAVVAAVVGLAGCQGGSSKEAAGGPQPPPASQPSGTGGSGSVEKVDPHTTGGTGGAGVEPRTPDPAQAVGAGSKSEHQEPKLESGAAAEGQTGQGAQPGQTGTPQR